MTIRLKPGAAGTAIFFPGIFLDTKTAEMLISASPERRLFS
jgi:hypothetical protein